MQRWLIRFVPLIDKEVRKRKKPASSSWRMDETYIKINGKWVYLYRAVDSCGNTIEFLLRKYRDAVAAKAAADKALVDAKTASDAALAAEKAASAKALADAKTASDAVVLAKDATIAKLTADNAAALKSIKDAFNSLAKKWNAKNPKAKVTYVK